MLIFSILIVAIVGTSITLLLRPLRPELSLLVSVITGIIIFLVILGKMSGVFDAIRSFMQDYNIDNSYFATLLKIIGITYLAQFGAQLCKDAGAGTIATKIELGGRVLILTCVIPVAVATLNAAVALLKDAMP